MLRVTSYGLRVLIFFFFLFLPVGWAKHWIVPNSLVNGVLVDYLMPDLWLQDIIAIVIIVLTVAQLRVSGFGFLKFLTRNTQTRNAVTHKLIPIFFILISIIMSPVFLTSVVNFGRLLLAMSVGWIILRNKNLHQPALMGLSGAVVWTTALAIGQFINQKTLFGWQFLGEPIYSLGTGGVKKIFLFGQQLVAPMATFPHANVMGAFGLLTFFILSRQKNKLFIVAKYCSLILVGLSFSLPVWLITLYLLSRKFKPAYATLILSIIGVFSLLITYYLLPITSFYRRLNLARHSLTIIKNHPFFGVGWGGFVRHLPPSTFMQPVHNVFLLVLAELGIIGATGLVLVAREFLKNFKIRNYILLATIYLLLATIDHYFWTTTQGIYMLWVIVSLL